MCSFFLFIKTLQISTDLFFSLTLRCLVCFRSFVYQSTEISNRFPLWGVYLAFVLLLVQALNFLNEMLCLHRSLKDWNHYILLSVTYEHCNSILPFLLVRFRCFHVFFSPWNCEMHHWVFKLDVLFIELLRTYL